MTNKDRCFPLKFYEDVLNWKCEDSCWAEKVTKINKRTEYCYPNRKEEAPYSWLCSVDVPKTIICHDMKGGYLEDQFVNDTESEDPYRFYNWWTIDLFIYFSHHFITIPPVGWINASHLHGVPILGTIITENASGVEICNMILESEERIKVFTSKLAEICQHYGFDGYLLNIENKIDTILMHNLVDFVKLLKDDLKAACSERETWVIWYDSVINPSGQLEWQNKLNQHNKIFFDACDGIFLNYCWKEEDLKESLECAGSRAKDVYVGIDVFGRGCYGGGGFNSVKALEVIRNFGLSAAIFAPGWTHEMQSKNNGDNFISREYKFWRNLWPFQYTYGTSTIPFRTTFCQGFGLKKYKKGNICSEKPWFNLRKQNYQPTWYTFEHLHEDEETSPCISLYTEEAYEGGSCLKLSPCNENKRIRLFYCEFNGQDGDSKEFYITIVFKFLQGNEEFRLNFNVHHEDKSGNTIGSKTSVQETTDIVTPGLVGVKKSDQAELNMEIISDRSEDHPNNLQKRLDNTIGSKTSVQETTDIVTPGLVGVKKSDQAELNMEIISDRSEDHPNNLQKRSDNTIGSKTSVQETTDIVTPGLVGVKKSDQAELNMEIISDRSEDHPNNLQKRSDNTIGSKTSVQETTDITRGIVGVKKRLWSELIVEVLGDRCKHHPNSWLERTFKLTHKGNQSLTEISIESVGNCSMLLGLLNVATKI